MKSQAYQWGETARSAQQKDDRAYARITEPARQSAAATIRNNQRPYHWKRHNCQRRYVLKYLHLGLNSRAQLALNSERQLTLNSRAHLVLRSEAHLRPCGRQQRAAVGLTEARQNRASRQKESARHQWLTFKAVTSRRQLARPQVSLT
jgi:hypothetical protein